MRSTVKRQHHLLNVIVLVLIIFTSGGVPIVNMSYVTLFTWGVMLVRAIRRNTRLIRAPLFAGMIGALLFVQHQVSDPEQEIHTYLIVFSYVITGLLNVLHYQETQDSFIDDLQTAIMGYAVAGIITFCLQPLCWYQGSSIILQNMELVTWKHLIYFNRLGYYGYFRNQSYFWEPGLLQIYLNLLLVIAIHIRKNWKLAAFAILSLILANSTAGYIVMLGVCLSGMWQWKRSPYLMAAVGIALLSMGVLMYDNILDKFSGDNSKSALDRQMDFEIGMALLEEHPWRGCGLSMQKNFITVHAIKLATKKYGENELEKLVGLTNSLVYMLQGLGIPGFIFFVWCHLRQRLFPQANWAVLGVVMLSAASEPILKMPFFQMFFVSGLLESWQAVGGTYWKGRAGSRLEERGPNTITQQRTPQTMT